MSFAHNLGGDASHQRTAEPAAAVRAHNDDIGVKVLTRSNNLVGGVPVKQMVLHGKAWIRGLDGAKHFFPLFTLVLRVG